MFARANRRSRFTVGHYSNASTTSSCTSRKRRIYFWIFGIAAATGDARIKGMLPPGTEVALKTGFIGGTVNDVGILNLPDDGGHVVLALFVMQGSKSESSERAIAQISRAVYDYFLFAVPAQ